MTTKKQQRNEVLNNEGSRPSSLRIGTQMYRNPSDLSSPNLEDRPKNVMLNKRVRTAVAETRAEFRNNGLPRQPIMAKDRDTVKRKNADPEVSEEKIRGLPVGGETWDKKMKRKRSVGAVYMRSNDGDVEPTRTIHHKLNNEPVPQSSDSQGANSRGAPKNELEKSFLSRDISSGLNKERFPPKPSVKLNTREDNHSIYPSLVTKGKASRGPRSGTNTTSPIQRVAGTSLDNWEPSTTSGAHNRKRAIPQGSSSPPITQWAGQRPHKISRTRRTNIVSPVSNHLDVHLSSEPCSSDFVLPKSTPIGTQINKVKSESVFSPARFTESEESGSKEKNEVEEKPFINAQTVGPSVTPLKKTKFLNKDENSDGVRRQGRSGRVSSISRNIREKSDIPVVNKPPRSIKQSSDKTGSKLGRPLKKVSDRKSFSRPGSVNDGSPDITGEFDDDREELVAAANLAYNANLLACSSNFWKDVDMKFTSINKEDKSYISEQLKLVEDRHDQFPQMFDITGDPNTVSGERKVHFQSSVLLTGEESKGIFDKDTPLYQRVLSALIMEDDVEEFEENGVGKCVYSPDEYASNVGVKVQENGSLTRLLPCNGFGNKYNVIDPPCNSDSQYQEMGFEDRLLLELQSIGLSPETVPDLRDKEDEKINQEYAQLQCELYQQTGRKKMRLDNMNKVVIQEGQDSDGRELEHNAMNGLVELAYKKLLATRGSLANKNGIPKVPKQVALSFAKRTLTRCRNFEDSRISCFKEPALRDIISAAPPRIYPTDPLSLSVTVTNGSSAGTEHKCPFEFEPYGQQSGQTFGKYGQASNRKRKEVPLDEVVSFRTNLGGAKGKRSDIPKAGRTVGNSKGERKMKIKHKQKTAQLSTSGSGYLNKLLETTHLQKPLASGVSLTEGMNKNVGSAPADMKETTMEFPNVPNDLDNIDDIGDDLGDNWLDFDVDGLQDTEFLGLDIPMDDLSELNMF